MIHRKKMNKDYFEQILSTMYIQHMPSQMLLTCSPAVGCPRATSAPRWQSLREDPRKDWGVLDCRCLIPKYNLFFNHFTGSPGFPLQAGITKMDEFNRFVPLWRQTFFRFGFSIFYSFTTFLRPAHSLAPAQFFVGPGINMCRNLCKIRLMIRFQKPFIKRF